MKLLIIDGNNLLHRVYWVAKKQENYNVNNIVLSFLKSIRYDFDKFKCDKIICTWDKKLQNHSSNFRIDESNHDYKATRIKNEEIYEATYLIDEFLETLGIKVMYPGCLEADDIMHYISVKNTDENIIVSSDRDILQLVNENTKIFNPIKKITYTKDNFESLIGNPIKDFVLIKAITGDNSDNIKGLKGYGIKRAKKLIQHPEKITNEQLQIIEKNLKLIDLSKGWQVNEPQEEYIYREQYNKDWPIPNKDNFYNLCVKNNINSILFYKKYWDIFFNKLNKNTSQLNSNFDFLL
jgi:DNA polymerase-1